MDKVLEIIARETFGESFKAKSFCYEDFTSPDGPIDQPNHEYTPRDWGETEKIRHNVDIRDKAFKIRKNRPIFSYFLDGSRRTYKIDDIGYGNRIYPVVAGQIGIGCCTRQNREMQRCRYERRNVIVLPKCANKDNERNFGQSLSCSISKNSSIYKKYNIKISDILFYEEKKDVNYEDSAISEIQNLMV